MQNNKLFILLLSFFIYPLRKFFKISTNTWVFGANDGINYIDNSKYFFEYVNNQKDKKINAVWITRSKNTVKEINNLGYTAYKNISLKGIKAVLSAKVIFFSTMRSDVLFSYKRKNRLIVNLWHGMPMKKIGYDYAPHRPENKNLKGKIWDKLVIGFMHSETDLIASTSEFFNTILKSSFRNTNTKIVGQPRTDAFMTWNKTTLKKKYNLPSEAKIITYMPTHRAYGRGSINPKIFSDNPTAIEYFNANNIILVWKFHKNMLENYQSNEPVADCFLDLSTQKVDPQELLFVTDMLITDYSSCYIDYMLLKRPFIFYFYDNYETEDNELYFHPKDHKIGPTTVNEKELLDTIKNAFNMEYSSPENYKLYHEIDTGDSSRSLFNTILKFTTRI